MAPSTTLLAIAISAITAACGRFGFEGRVDARDIDARPIVPGLVAMTGNTGNMTSTLQLPIPTVIAGDLVVVAIAVHGTATVASVVDGSGVGLTTATRAVGGGVASEIWYEADAQPASMMAVTMMTSSNFDVWIAEFSGTKPGPPAMTSMGCLTYPPDFAMAPATTTTPNELVVSVTMFAAPVFVSAADPPFTSFPALTGNDAVYYVAPTPGTYATTWQIAMGAGMTSGSCASTAEWPPGA